MGLTPAQQRACKSLDAILRTVGRKDNESDILACEQEWYSRLEVADERALRDDDEEYEDDDGEYCLGDESTDECAPPEWQQIADNPTEVGILELLVSLYTQLPTGEDDKFFSPIIRFAVLSSLRQTGQWLPPRRITHLLAVLLFCGREVLMAIMHQCLLDDPTIRYSKYILHAIPTTSTSYSQFPGRLSRLHAFWTTIVKVQCPQCISL
jgi:hypothetical protein